MMGAALLVIPGLAAGENPEPTSKLRSRVMGSGFDAARFPE